MQIDALPRLTDEERELADDEYVVMPAAVPANLSIDDLIAQRTAALYAMRTAGDDFATFSQASRQEAHLSAEIRHARRQAFDSLWPNSGDAPDRCETPATVTGADQSPSPLPSSRHAVRCRHHRARADRLLVVVDAEEMGRLRAMPVWMVALLVSLSVILIWLVRAAWREGAADRAQAKTLPERQYWWPQPTRERTAKLHAMIVTLLTGTCFLLGWRWAGVAGYGGLRGDLGDMRPD